MSLEHACLPATAPSLGLPWVQACVASHRQPGVPGLLLLLPSQDWILTVIYTLSLVSGASAEQQKHRGSGCNCQGLLLIGRKQGDGVGRIWGPQRGVTEKRVAALCCWAQEYSG